MTAALLTPITTDLATAVGPRTFRKQVLPLKSITYKGQQLDFSRDYLASLAESFRGRAYDSVKFFLAPDDNSHTVDPERMRGTVKALELADDGLDAIIEVVSDEAAQLVRDHPDLGVSCRIVPNLVKSDGRTYPAAVQHVLGTVDPVVTGMRPWQAVDLSEPTDSDVDLTAEMFHTPKESGMPELTDAQQARLDQLLGLPDEQFTALVTQPDPPTGDDGKRTGLLTRLREKISSTADEPDLTDAELEALAADAEAHVNSETNEPAGAALSAEQQAALDLAQATAAQAMTGNYELATQLAASNWRNERAALVRKGVPPAVLDLAEPVLSLPAGAIDLSNSAQGAPDPVEALRKVVEACEGMVDLSVIGETPDEAKTADNEAQAVARQFRQTYGFGQTPPAAATTKES